MSRAAVHLINTNPGHYKYYDMLDLGNGTFKATWGRIGKTATVKIYPISRWDSKYREKLTVKHYRDVTGHHFFRGDAVRTDNGRIGVVTSQTLSATLQVYFENGKYEIVPSESLSLATLDPKNMLQSLFLSKVLSKYEDIQAELAS